MARSISKSHGTLNPLPTPYLLDIFNLSPWNTKTNLRTDSYGGSPLKRAKFALDIISSVRAAVPAGFCVGMKLNSADHNSDTFEDTMTQIGLLVEAGIDFFEVSGGSYINPEVSASYYLHAYIYI